MSSCEQIEQFTGFGLYDKSFIQTLRNLKDPTPFIRGIVAELGPRAQGNRVHPAPAPRGQDPQQLVQPVRRRHAELYQLHQGRYAHCNVRRLPGGGAELLVGLFYLIAKLLFWGRVSAPGTRRR